MLRLVSGDDTGVEQLHNERQKPPHKVAKKSNTHRSHLSKNHDDATSTIVEKSPRQSVTVARIEVHGTWSAGTLVVLGYHGANGGQGGVLGTVSSLSGPPELWVDRDP
ncbi:hypothetical protein KM043_018401 [Ampulex compressa]|nr:hypothetical protein KM043_018401 [Ampulex compressa]